MPTKPQRKNSPRAPEAKGKPASHDTALPAALLECRGLPELADFVKSLRRGATRPARDRDKELAPALSEMHLIKDAQEVAELKSVIASTKRGFEDVIRWPAVPMLRPIALPPVIDRS